MKIRFMRLISILLLIVGGCQPPPPTKLRVLCGSSMAAPVQEIGKAFAAAYRVEVEYDFGGAETLHPRVLAGVAAEIFVCHDPFEAKLQGTGRMTDSVTVGYLEPVIAVRPGNPKNIRSLADLARPGLQIGIGDPRYSTAGELFVNVLRERGLYDAVMSNVVVQGRTHADIANSLILGPVDAVAIWNFAIPLHKGKLEVIHTDARYPATRVTIVGLASSERPQLRDAFLAWCRRPEVLRTFQQHGYVRQHP